MKKLLKGCLYPLVGRPINTVAGHAGLHGLRQPGFPALLVGALAFRHWEHHRDVQALCPSSPSPTASK